MAMATKSATSSINAKVDLLVTDNKLLTLASYLPPQGEGLRLTSDEIRARLRDSGVTFGLIDDNIEKMAMSDVPVKNIVVAEALKPTVGEKAHIEPYFEINARRKAMIKEDGNVDFHDLGEISSALSGQELYRKIPPTVGDSGTDVTGKEIPGILGRDLKMVLGPGTKFDDKDKNLVRAAIDGEIIVRKGTVQISEVHKVPGDVDFSSGNLKFNGSIKIAGGVKSGFSVEAEGDIEIQGMVEDATIIAGNDVIVQGGFAGSGDGDIKAGRDVIVKFIENQRIEAERDIVISGASYHAKLQARRSILAQGGKSMIVGGTAEAKISVKAARFGSDAFPKTVIRIGTDPKLNEKILALEEEIRLTEESSRKLEQSSIFLYKIKIDNDGTLPPEKREMLEKIEAARSIIPEKLKMLRKSLEGKKAEFEQVANAEAKADVAAFPKVQICIGQQKLNVVDKLGPSLFKMNKGEIMRFSK